MGNPGQKQHWNLHYLSQKCPRCPVAFEDGDPFTLEKQDVIPEQCTCHTDTLSQCINTRSPTDKLYHLLVITLLVFWQENSRISQSLALFLWRHTMGEMHILRRKKSVKILAASSCWRSNKNKVKAREYFVLNYSPRIGFCLTVLQVIEF